MMKWFWRIELSIARSKMKEKMTKFLYLDFWCVAINIKRLIKALYLINGYSHIWLKSYYKIAMPCHFVFYIFIWMIVA